MITTTDIEQDVKKIIEGGADAIAVALADALEDAVEWNWMDDGVPENVQQKVYAALEASLLNGVVVAVTDSACLCQWQNISLHVIRASQI